MRTRDILSALRRADFCPIGAYITAIGDITGYMRVCPWPSFARTPGANKVIKVFDGPDDMNVKKGCWDNFKNAREAIKLCREYKLIGPIEDFCRDTKEAFKHVRSS